MVRKSAFILGIVLSAAGLVLDGMATSAEACGGCRRNRCCSSGCSSGCSTTYYAPAPAPCCNSCNTCNSCCYTAPTCCSSGSVAGYYGAPAYSYAVAPGYAASYGYTMPAQNGTYYSGYAAPVSTYRSRSVFRFASFGR